MGDFAVGLSRQLYGLTMHCERPRHRMYEQWHPLGPVGVITAFNFPVAVWAWNAMVAAVCGDTMIWKPSHQAPLTAIAVHQDRRARARGATAAPASSTSSIGGRADVGERMVADRAPPADLGDRLDAAWAARSARCVADAPRPHAARARRQQRASSSMDDADLDLALRAVLFAAVGTAGQRCTTTRRLFLQKGIAAEMTRPARRRLRARSASATRSSAGDAHGPADRRARGRRHDAGARAREARRAATSSTAASGSTGPGFFVEPTIVEAHADMPIVCEETFAPILYVLRVRRPRRGDRDPQRRAAGALVGDLHRSTCARPSASSPPRGSDCGIANVNIGTSGAEIGGAFGGEKETGGGREAGSDSWKAYMRRQTCTINYGTDLPLAQGVQFDV